MVVSRWVTLGQARFQLFIWTAVGFFPLAHAQLVPDPSGDLQRQDRQRQELRQQNEIPAWSPSSIAGHTPPHQQIPFEEPCSVVDRVSMRGALQNEALHAALRGVNADDSPLGRCLGSQGITLLIQRVQQALVEQGYITSQASVPEQDLRAGTLVIDIKEGRLARIRSEETETRLPHLAWALEEGDILNLRDIEQSSDNLQRLPSLQSKLQIAPGEAPGTSDLLVELQAQRPIRFALGLDDTGSRSSGKLQGNATLSWDNPLGLADFFYVTQGKDVGDRDSGPRGSRNQILHYSLPWGYWSLGVTLSDNQYHQTVYGPYESYVYSGSSRQKELTLSRVIHRDGVSKTTSSLKGFVRQSRNHIADLEVLVQRRHTAGWEAGLQHLRYFESSTLQAQLNYRRGTGAFGAQPAPEEATGEGTGRMQLVTGLLYWTKPITGGAHPWQYNSQLQWQWSQTRLTAQDRMCLGGRSSVRGFDGQQTLCGERGQLWRQEVSTALPAVIIFASGIRIYAALDAGRVTTQGEDRALRLAGMGLGLRGQHRLADAYPVQWEVFIGRPVSRPEGFGESRHTTGFSLRAEF